MRRAVAAALLGIALWIGALAWSGFVLLNTVLDPDRSERIAEELYEDPAVRDRLASNIAAAAQAALPPDVPITDEQIDAAAQAALSSPAVEALVVDAFVATHQAFLGEGEPPTSLDAGAFGAAGREALVSVQPDLDAVLPEAPALAVPLPTEHVPDLGPVRRGLDAAVPLLAALAAFGAVLALVISSNRPAVLRRAGLWAIALAALILVVAFGVPAFVSAYFPEQAEVVAALVTAMAETTRGPALALALAGLAAVVVSFVWRTVPAPSSAAPPRRHAPAPAPRSAARRNGVRTSPARRPRAGPPVTAAAAGPPIRPPVAGPPVVAPPVAPTVVAPSPAPTAVVPAPPEPRWVEGVGWVHDPADAVIPDDARWVPGVGYVRDKPR